MAKSINAFEEAAAALGATKDLISNGQSVLATLETSSRQTISVAEQAAATVSTTMASVSSSTAKVLSEYRKTAEELNASLSKSKEQIAEISRSMHASLDGAVTRLNAAANHSQQVLAAFATAAKSATADLKQSADGMSQSVAASLASAGRTIDKAAEQAQQSLQAELGTLSERLEARAQQSQDAILGSVKTAAENAAASIGRAETATSLAQQALQTELGTLSERLEARAKQSQDLVVGSIKTAAQSAIASIARAEATASLAHQALETAHNTLVQQLEITRKEIAASGAVVQDGTAAFRLSLADANTHLTALRNDQVAIAKAVVGSQKAIVKAAEETAAARSAIESSAAAIERQRVAGQRATRVLLCGMAVCLLAVLGFAIWVFIRR